MRRSTLIPLAGLLAFGLTSRASGLENLVFDEPGPAFDFEGLDVSSNLSEATPAWGGAAAEFTIQEPSGYGNRSERSVVFDGTESVVATGPEGPLVEPGGARRVYFAVRMRIENASKAQVRLVATSPLQHGPRFGTKASGEFLLRPAAGGTAVASSESPIVGDWYEVVLVIEQGAAVEDSFGSLWVRNLSRNERAYRVAAGLKNIPLNFTSTNHAAQYDRIDLDAAPGFKEFDHLRAGRLIQPVDDLPQVLEDFERLGMGSDLSSLGWTHAATDFEIGAPSGTGNASARVVQVAEGPAFSGGSAGSMPSEVRSEDTTRYGATIRVALGPASEPGAAQVRLKGSSNGPRFGTLSTGSGSFFVIRPASGSPVASADSPTQGHWYEYRLEVEPAESWSEATGTLYVRNLTEDEDNFWVPDGLESVPLGLSTGSNPGTYDEWQIDAKAGATEIDDLRLEVVRSYTTKRNQELKSLVLQGDDTWQTLLFDIADGADLEAAEAAIATRITNQGVDMGFQRLDFTLAYRLFRDELGVATREVIAAWLEDMFQPGTPTQKQHFSFGGDNLGFAAAYLLIVGGEAIGRADATSAGIERLRNFLEIQRLNGLNSEHNSPVYTPISLFSIEAIASLAESREARVLARVIAERLWLDVVMRFHAPSSHFGAPLSRCNKLRDLLGVGSQLAYTVYPLLPRAILLDDESFPAISHHWESIGRRSFIRHFLDRRLAAIAEGAMIASTTSREVVATSFRPHLLSDPDAWSGSRYAAKTRQTRWYSMGAAEQPYTDGSKSSTFQVHWTSAQPAASEPGDARTLYTRYRMNDRLPDLDSEQYSVEDGYIRAVQHGSAAVVLYRPKLEVNGVATSLDASIMVPRPDRIREVRVNGTVPPTLPATYSGPESVLIDDGDVFIAIHPLHVSDLGRDVALRLEEVEEHLIVSYLNFSDAEPGTWTEAELRETRNGFVVEVADSDAFTDFTAFAAAVAIPEITDVVGSGVREVAYCRAACGGAPSIEVHEDLESGELVLREFDGGPPGDPLLDSETTVASLEATMTLGGATLLGGAGGQPRWLTVEPVTGSYSVLQPFRMPEPLELNTPGGKLRSSGLGLAKLVYQPGPFTRLVIDVYSAPEPLHFSKPQGAFVVIVNDEDVTASIGTEVLIDDEVYLRVPLPEPSSPLEEAELSVAIDGRTTLSALSTGGTGKLCATVSNDPGAGPARDVVVLPFVEGLARVTLPLQRTVAELVAGSSEPLQCWSLKGLPGGINARLHVTATAQNSSPAEDSAP